LIFQQKKAITLKTPRIFENKNQNTEPFPIFVFFHNTHLKRWKKFQSNATQKSYKFHWAFPNGPHAPGHDFPEVTDSVRFVHGV